MPPDPGIPASQSMTAAVLGFAVVGGGLVLVVLSLWLWMAWAKRRGRRMRMERERRAVR